MKILKISLIIVLGLLFTPTFGQKVTKKVTKEICSCFDKIKPDAPIETLQEQSSNCITSGIMDNIAGLVKEYKIKGDDEKGAEKMGEAIGIKLVEDCESARNIFILLEGAKEKEGEPVEEKK